MGSEERGEEEPIYYYVLKTHKPHMEGPLPGHKALLPSGPGSWRLWGSGWGPPSEMVTMAFTDDKWGLADLGEAELSLTKEAPCAALFPYPLQTCPCP